MGEVSEGWKMANVVFFFLQNCCRDKQVLGEEGRVIAIVHMDIHKSFDKVLQGRLFWKVGSHRIQGMVAK